MDYDTREEKEQARSVYDRPRTYRSAAFTVGLCKQIEQNICQSLDKGDGFGVDVNWRLCCNQWASAAIDFLVWIGGIK